MEGKVKQITQLGYLSVTTAGMAFGLLCITIASLVSSSGVSDKSIVRNAWTWSCAERRRRCYFDAQGSRYDGKRGQPLLQIFLSVAHLLLP